MLLGGLAAHLSTINLEVLFSKKIEEFFHVIPQKTMLLVGRAAHLSTINLEVLFSKKIEEFFHVIPQKTMLLVGRAAHLSTINYQLRSFVFKKKMKNLFMLSHRKLCY